LFYHKALEDSQIGHYFQIELGDDLESTEWVEHIDLLVNFWASVFMGEERYKGDPYGPHFTIIGLEQKDFDRWVELFTQIANEVYTPEIATLLEEKGIYYAQDFMRRLNTARNEEDLKGLKSKIGWEG